MITIEFDCCRTGTGTTFKQWSLVTWLNITHPNICSDHGRHFLRDNSPISLPFRLLHPTETLKFRTTHFLLVLWKVRKTEYLQYLHVSTGLGKKKKLEVEMKATQSQERQSALQPRAGSLNRTLAQASSYAKQETTPYTAIWNASERGCWSSASVLIGFCFSSIPAEL